MITINTQNNLAGKFILSLFWASLSAILSIPIYAVKNFIDTEQISTPFDLETLQAAVRIASGIAISPTDLLAAAGVLATLYIATSLASRIHLSEKDEKTRGFIEKQTSHLAYLLSIYSLVCMHLYFFQEDRGQLSFGDFMFYLAPASIFYYISAYPPLDISDLKQREKENKKRIKKLTDLDQEAKQNGNTIPDSALQAAQSLTIGSEWQKLKQYLKFAKKEFRLHISILFLTSPILWITLLTILINAFTPENQITDIFTNFPWVGVVILILLYLTQLFSLEYIYTYGINKTKSEILGEESSFTLTPILIYQAIILLMNSMPLLEFSLRDWRPLLESSNPRTVFIYAVILLALLSFLCGPIILWRIYKNYRKYLRKEIMGEAFKKEILEQALKEAEEESRSLQEKIKETQVAVEPSSQTTETQNIRYQTLSYRASRSKRAPSRQLRAASIRSSMRSEQ